MYVVGTCLLELLGMLGGKRSCINFYIKLSTPCSTPQFLHGVICILCKPTWVSYHTTFPFVDKRVAGGCSLFRELEFHYLSPFHLSCINLII